MDNDVNNPSDSSEGRITSIKYTFSQSPLYRTIHMNGAWGGITSQSEIQMGIYSEHHPYPDSMTLGVLEGGKLGDELERNQIAGFIREIEVNVIMDLDAAIALRNWLSTRIDQLQNVIEERGEKS